MKKSTISNFLDVLSSSLRCCLLSKTKISKSNFLGFDIRTVLPFIFMAIAMTSFTVTAQNLPGTVPVLTPVGGFGIDGEGDANFPTAGIGDWFLKSPPYPGTGGSLFDASMNPLYPAMTFFLQDAWGDLDPTTFTSSNKINDNPTTYTWGPGNVPDKNEIQNVGVHFAYGNPAIQYGVTDDLWCIFAADRQVTNGDAYIDFEFLQKPLTKLGSTSGGFLSEGTADGRTVGDLLVTLIFTNGGTAAEVQIRTWQAASKGYEYVLQPNSNYIGSIFVTNNNAPTTVPFDVYGTFPGVYVPNQWVEGAVNLTQLLNFGANPCAQVSTLFVRTKTSQSVSAELKDFPVGLIQLELGAPEVVVSCPTNVIMPACSTPEQINTAFAAWKAGFSYTGGVPPITESYTTTGGATVDMSVLAPPNVCGGTVSITYTVTDFCEQTDTCTATFTVNAPPAVNIAKAVDKTTEACSYADQAAANKAFADWLLTASVSGGCAPTSTPDTTTAPPYCGGDVKVTWTIADKCYTTSTYSAIFSITAPPAVVVVPALDKTTSACSYEDQAAVNSAFATWLTTASVSGGCSPTSTPDITTAPPYCGGDVKVTWTIADKCYDGMTYSATFSITAPPAVKVVEAEDKEICSYENQAQADAAFAAWLATASVSGGCAPTSAPDITTPPLYNGGSQKVTWTITDKCYTSSYDSTFTIHPLPEITCPNPETAQVVCGLSAKEAQDDANAKFATWFAQFATLNPGFTPVVTYVYTPASAQPITGTAPVIPVIGSPALANPTAVTVTWTITDANGCENSCSATYSQEYACVISCNIKQVTNAKCNKDTNGSITVTAQDGTPPYVIYLYNKSDLTTPIANSGALNTEPSEFTFSGLGAGDYVTESTDAVVNRGDGAPCEATVTEPTAVEATDASTKVTCIDGKDGSVTLTFSGGTPPYMVNFNGGGFETQTSPATYSGLTVGTYNWVVKDANDCSVRGSEEVGYIPCEKALCTYTQGYYGNPGGMSCADGQQYTTTELIAKALASYGGTMTIGLPGRSIYITAPDDIDDVIRVLPGGGSSYALLAGDIRISASGFSSYLRKGNINNTLLAQTITLGLNLGIDGNLGDFALQAGMDMNGKPIELATAMPEVGCGSDIPMPRGCSLPEGYGTLVNDYEYFTFPAFVNGMTVQELFTMANAALGGVTPPNGVTLSSLASAVDMVNNAFDGCRISMGYAVEPIVCSSASPQEFVAFEVPIVNNQLTIKYKFSYVSDVTIDVFDAATGAKLFSKFDANSYLDKEVKIDYNFNTGTQKVYIVRLTTRLGHDEQKVLSSPY